jgi:hypothetical protein
MIIFDELGPGLATIARGLVPAMASWSGMWPAISLHNPRSVSNSSREEPTIASLPSIRSSLRRSRAQAASPSSMSAVVKPSWRIFHSQPPTPTATTSKTRIAISVQSVAGGRRSAIGRTQ